MSGSKMRAACRRGRFVNMHASESGEERDSLFPFDRLKGNIVIAPGSVATRDSAKAVPMQSLTEISGAGDGADKEHERPKYLYVWGAVRYDDGFRTDPAIGIIGLPASRPITPALSLPRMPAIMNMQTPPIRSRFYSALSL